MQELLILSGQNARYILFNAGQKFIRAHKLSLRMYCLASEEEYSLRFPTWCFFGFQKYFDFEQHGLFASEMHICSSLAIFISKSKHLRHLLNVFNSNVYRIFQMC